MEKPDNLIPEAKMVEVLKDLALVNAAKTTNVSILRDNDIKPMAYIFEKHDIDSVQFVESDRYYASLPVQYEQIYKAVEAQIEKETTILEKEKEVNDSLKLIERERKEADKKLNSKKATDALP